MYFDFETKSSYTREDEGNPLVMTLRGASQGARPPFACRTQLPTEESNYSFTCYSMHRGFSIRCSSDEPSIKDAAAREVECRFVCMPEFSVGSLQREHKAHR